MVFGLFQCTEMPSTTAPVYVTNIATNLLVTNFI